MKSPSSSSPPSPLARAIRLASYAVGLALAVAAVWSWQVPQAQGEAHTQVSFEVNLTGELGVTPAGTFLSASRLTAGADRPSRGRFHVRNQTPARLSLRPRAVPATRALDRLLLVSVDTPGRRLFHGTLRELRSGTDRTLTLVPGEARTLRVRAWLRPGADAAGGGRERVRLELPSKALR